MIRVLPLLSLLASTAFAAAPAPTPITDLLADRSGYDASLAGDEWISHILDGKRVGWQHLEVGPAPAESGATYRVRTHIELRDRRTVIDTTALLDARFALVRVDEREEVRAPGEPPNVTTLTLQVANGRVTGVDRDENVDFSVSGPVYSDLFAMRMLARVVKRHGAYSFPVLDVPRKQTVDQVFEVTAVRGKAPARTARQLRPGPHVVFHLDKAGRILEMNIGTVHRRVLTTEAQAKPPSFAPTDPRSPVLTYLRVMSGELHPDAVDAVSDWTAIGGSFKSTLPADDIARRIKKDLARLTGSISPAEADERAANLRTTIKGHEAVVHFPERDKFRLRRVEGQWRIVELSRHQHPL